MATMPLSVWFECGGWVALLLLTAVTSAPPLQQASSLCLSMPCQNGGVCEEPPPTYRCQCALALRCEESNDLCHPGSCQGSVSCRPSSYDPQEFVCECETQQPRGSCEASVHHCATTLCGEEPHCQAPPTSYTCACRPGFMGPHCEVPVNPCTSSPCKNKALCRARGGDYSCYCVPGFQGERCEVEVNECVSQPCQNGATCLNKIGKYTCLCKAGYTGQNCELQIDECQSQPCLNEGRCHDYLNGFSCSCHMGFQGDFCEINIDECKSQPCQNGSPCLDGVNSCDCSGSGFMGMSCDVPVPPCMLQPCLNGAVCKEDHGNYTCICWPGFQGRHCEVDISECYSSPCLSGSKCMELSWRALYGVEPLFPDTFDPQNAAGFVCKCNPGLEGVLCEEDIDECAMRPCHNGGVCTNSHGGYSCDCSRASSAGLTYGGQNCSQPLLGCRGHACINGATCLPLLTSGQHDYICRCPAGFSGPRCQLSTTFSLRGAGYLRVESQAEFNVSLSFKTALAEALLAQWESGQHFATLVLISGRPHLSLRVGGALSQTLELPYNLSDARWHSVAAVVGDGLLELRLKDVFCQHREDCEKMVKIETAHMSRESTFSVTFIGGVGAEEQNPGEGPPVSALIGCLQDVHMDSKLMVPEVWLSLATAVNITPGCTDRNWCVGNPCQSRGQCVNLWQNHLCKCNRPYEGKDCSEEYIPGRFGQGGAQSYAVFTVEDTPGSDVLISMFLRTRRPAGLLLLLSNSSGPYLSVWLQGGRVKVQLQGSGLLTGAANVSDGQAHLVGFRLEHSQLSLLQGGAISIPPLQVQTGDALQLGGVADPSTAASFGGYFRGCVQDVRINSKRLEFYPKGSRDSSYTADLLVNVTRGCTDDDACISNPCQNGGTCVSVWDDFACTCPPNSSGRLCQEVEWCELAPCPAVAVCQPQLHGFECISNATFDVEGSAISYRSNGRIKRNLTTVSFHIRTQQPNVTVLHAFKGPEFLTVSVESTRLLLELQSGGKSESLSLKSRSDVSDGKWHSVRLSMRDPLAHTSHWDLVVDGKEERLSSVMVGNLDFLREEMVELLVGGLGRGAEGNLAGCLSTLDIGGLALPYYGHSETLIPRPQEEQFVKMSQQPVSSGCTGAPVCKPNPCLHSGTCSDLFNLFSCTCVPGWEGQRCGARENTCRSSPCIHGNCSSRWPIYQCTCQPGYTGANCERELDQCLGHRCANGATCLHGHNTYSCLCPQNYYGPLCTEPVEEVPWFIVKVKRPMLPVSFCGNEQKNYTCFNGGNCTDTLMLCECPSGFTGDRCEVEINECNSNPCMNGGYCRNLINKFHCNCPMNFAGEICQTDLSADQLTSDLLLSVCLVSAALALAIVLAVASFLVALKRRATHGTYSPSRQEKEGSRVEMWNIVQPPPMERLI